MESELILILTHFLVCSKFWHFSASCMVFTKDILLPGLLCAKLQKILRPQTHNKDNFAIFSNWKCAATDSVECSFNKGTFSFCIKISCLWAIWFSNLYKNSSSTCRHVNLTTAFKTNLGFYFLASNVKLKFPWLNKLSAGESFNQYNCSLTLATCENGKVQKLACSKNYTCRETNIARVILCPISLQFARKYIFLVSLWISHFKSASESLNM